MMVRSRPFALAVGLVVAAVACCRRRAAAVPPEAAPDRAALDDTGIVNARPSCPTVCRCGAEVLTCFVLQSVLTFSFYPILSNFC
jgi:hypothetical protein